MQDIHIRCIGGSTNQNYSLTVGGERFVLRIGGENASHLGIDRSQELAALHAAAAASIGPEMVAFLMPQGYLVTRWIDWRHWQALEFRAPENVRLLIKMGKHLHALPSSEAASFPFQRVAAYLETAHRYAVLLPSCFDACLETMSRVEADQQNDPSR